MKSIASLALTFFVIFSFVGVSALGRYYYTEPIVAGEEAELLVTVRNPTDKNFDDVIARLFIYDLGIMLSSSGFEVDDKSSIVARMYWNAPKNTPPGLYLAKFSVSKYDLKDTQHVYLRIV